MTSEVFFFSFVITKYFFSLIVILKDNTGKKKTLWLFYVELKLCNQGINAACFGLIELIKSDVSDRMGKQISTSFSRIVVFMSTERKLGMFHENMKASFVPPSSRPVHLPSPAPEV